VADAARGGGEGDGGWAGGAEGVSSVWHPVRSTLAIGRCALTDLVCFFGRESCVPV
jgi:hypothetical protein